MCNIVLCHFCDFDKKKYIKRKISLKPKPQQNFVVQDLEKITDIIIVHIRIFCSWFETVYSVNWFYLQYVRRCWTLLSAAVRAKKIVPLARSTWFISGSAQLSSLEFLYEPSHDFSSLLIWGNSSWLMRQTSQVSPMIKLKIQPSIIDVLYVSPTHGHGSKHYPQFPFPHPR